MRHMRWIGGALALTAVLVALLGLALLPVAPVAAQNVACYRAQGGALWACGDGGTMRFASGSTLDVQSGATVYITPTMQLAGGASIIGNTSIGNGTNANTLAVWGTATFGTDVNLTKQASISVVNGSTITPTGSYQPLTAAAAAGTSDIVAGAAGDLLILVNVGSNTITLTDTGTLLLSGNAALGQYDTLTLIADGTNWVQLATSNN